MEVTNPANEMEAEAKFWELVQEWDWDEEAFLPTPVEDGSFKLVNTDNGWESTERYATQEDAQVVLGYRERAFFEVPGSQDYRFCEQVIAASAEWVWAESQQRYRWICPD